MKQLFKSISSTLFDSLKEGEILSVSLSGENSQFIRLSKAKIRQTGLVHDFDLGLKMIHNGRTVSGGITLSGHSEFDEAQSLEILGNLREEIVQLPEDPFIVIPKGSPSSDEIQTANGLHIDDAVGALIPAMADADLVGIWASGKIYRGNANSLGQFHWFETDSFSLDYSLVTPNHQMVKGTFSGQDWNQDEYEKNIANSVRKLTLMDRKPVKVTPGDYRTWFEPEAVSDFLGMFSWYGISEGAIQRRSSSFGKMRYDGVKLSPHFSLDEDFTSGLVPKFNNLGEIANPNLPLIKNGELINGLVSSRTASEFGVVSNFAESGEYLRAPKMNTGDLNSDSVVDAIGDGLFLSNIHYLNWSDNAGGRVTGLTRYACFKVENGELVAPIETMRFDDTIYRYFGTELEAVGDEVKIIPEIETYNGREIGGTICPGILVNAFSLTL
ncbi:MAG: TldD/PmbA family protein [Candidatus Marinimicrobia bacterium]|jgi:predicted Zn-dependent protease|nr:TldD/PmbA family protein [Candidatus Neomarinimicrobiota bacterium]MBT3617841.1 TldD/PmbA family protein [Candidatus Neomarinimicrobiota bacterium]MBT3828198.1 TldD/PmbA family protein [Candidatus Neomarinimicrobiota bacterium]MBT3997115.1 TldD/PmbA family protein [Candidatus Neomarinimicrobiota bacterium]MBT4280581.1 TldD/PmbA family protein [Candidatus Neomarinimicrobiota bacterium]